MLIPSAMVFTADFKLGHYMKVPPRPMFWAQVRQTRITSSNISYLCINVDHRHHHRWYNTVGRSNLVGRMSAAHARSNVFLYYRMFTHIP